MKKFYFLCFFTIILLVSIKVLDENKSFSIKNIQLYDSYDDGNISIYDVFDENGIIDKFNAIYQIMNESGFEYIEVMKQPIEFVGYYYGETDTINGDEDCRNQIIDTDVITPLCSLQLSNQVQKKCDISNLVIEGHAWNKNDFWWDENMDINVIMGSSYKDHFDIGDNLEVIYLGKKIRVNVIGFLKEGATINYLQYDENLDDIILMPAININKEYMHNSRFEQILYLQKIECFAKCYTNEQFSELKDKIKNISNEYDFKYGYFQINEGLSRIDTLNHYLLTLIYLNIIIVLLFFIYIITTKTRSYLCS